MELADIGKEIRKLVLESLKETVPEATANFSKLSKLKDSSTKALGYSKLKTNYTP
jgi:hypothetical protein